MPDKLDWRFDLQLFAADDKTEQPTPKRKQDTRKKGQTAKSTELSSALVLLAGIMAVYLLLPGPLRRFFQYAAGVWANLPGEDLTIASAGRLFWQLALQAGLVLLPLFAVLLLVAWLASVVQVGWLLSGKPLQPDFSRLNPLSGLKRMFSKRSFVELLKALFKLCGVAFLAYRSALLFSHWSSAYVGSEIAVSFQALAGLVYRTALQVGWFLLVLGVADYLFQRWDFHQNLRMSKQEVKEEYKQAEGDPKIKAQIREKQRQLSRRRMMEAVPQADVVIVNPTHIAIALQYDPKRGDAPVVLAKGQGYLAQRIKEIARTHRISFVEDKPLAHALFQTVEIGQAIPAEFYQAVAEILAFVFRSKQRRLG